LKEAGFGKKALRNSSIEQMRTLFIAIHRTITAILCTKIDIEKTR